MSGPQTRVEPLGRAHPDDKLKPVQGVVFPSTPEGKKALEHFKATGEILPPPETPQEVIDHFRATGELLEPKPAILPGLPGGPPLLPSDREVPEGQEGELVIFDSSDVEQALRQFKIAAGDAAVLGIDVDGSFNPKLVGAMRTVMMFTLQLAAINLGVQPGSRT